MEYVNFFTSINRLTRHMSSFLFELNMMLDHMLQLNCSRNVKEEIQ